MDGPLLSIRSVSTVEAFMLSISCSYASSCAERVQVCCEMLWSIFLQKPPTGQACLHEALRAQPLPTRRFIAETGRAQLPSALSTYRRSALEQGRPAPPWRRSMNGRSCALHVVRADAVHRLDGAVEVDDGVAQHRRARGERLPLRRGTALAHVPGSAGELAGEACASDEHVDVQKRRLARNRSHWLRAPFMHIEERRRLVADAAHIAVAVEAAAPGLACLS